MKDFKPIPFHQPKYNQSLEYQEMERYLLDEATTEELREILASLSNIPDEMIFGGNSYGFRKITRPFWIWNVGTSKSIIEHYFVMLGFARAMLERDALNDK
jgi:hypothetical protein